MRSASLLGASLLVVLATACGDDGGNNNNGTCGDGHVTGSEQCDDGNTTSGDGCSATCTTESTTGHCGDNVVDVATEQCDDGNTTSGDGCSATCQNEVTVKCGNGMMDSGEACDDHNTTAGDGCSATCTVETGYTCTGTPSVCTMGGTTGSGTCNAPFPLTFTGTTTLVAMGSGDTTNSTDQIPETACIDPDVVEGGAHDQIWTFTLTDTRDVLIEIDAATRAFDSSLRVMTAPCDAATSLPDSTGTNGCADYGYAGDGEYLGYVKLAPGTYYIAVDGYDDTEVGTYDLKVTAVVTTCGDGALDPLEQCDDGASATGDGCNDKCAVEPGYSCDDSEPSVCALACGNGTLDAGEDCDDGDTDTGDGCDATCHVETGYTCDTSEPSVCTQAGCGNGIIESTEECDDGNMMSGDRCSSSCVLEQDVTEAAEPNDTTPQALTAGNHIIRGTFQTGDVDLYTFTLTATSKVEIETYSTINGVTTDYDGKGTLNIFDCPTSADDSEVAVFPSGADTTMDAMATAIDDDDGDHFCSYLGPNDGSDDSMTDPTQLAALPAGTYTIRVRTAPFAIVTIPAGTRYMLDLKITPMGSSTAVVPAPGDIVINEFLADEGTGLSGDSNCDADASSSDDEFIEFVNVSNKTLDLTGLTIHDAGTMTQPPHLEFTFAAQPTGSLTLAPGKAVVVWGGGVPACTGATNFFVAPDQATPGQTQHTLSLNNAGDTITLATGGANPVTIAQTMYGAATTFTSFNLDPDMTGTSYALHTAITGHVGTFSPGTKADGTAF